MNVGTPGRQGYVPNETIKKAATTFAYEVAAHIIGFTKYLEKARNDTISVDDMKEILGDNVAALERHGDADGKKIAGVVREALAYDGSQEEKAMKTAQAEQDAKWKTIHSILSEHEKENATMKAELLQVIR